MVNADNVTGASSFDTISKKLYLYFNLSKPHKHIWLNKVVDGAYTSNDYIYDASENLTKDLNKNITQITYNVLNLPKVVTFGNTNTITYTYDGSGNKLSVAYTAGGTTVKTDCVGNKVYKDGTLWMEKYVGHDRVL